MPLILLQYSPFIKLERVRFLKQIKFIIHQVAYESYSLLIKHTQNEKPHKQSKINKIKTLNYIDNIRNHVS